MSDNTQALDRACAHFRALLEKQLARVENMKAQGDFVDYKALRPLIIGVCGGDGIGPVITGESRRVLEFLLKDEIAAGAVEIRDIPGLTIENRIAQGKAIPDDVLQQLKACHVILKGPTTTPRKGTAGPTWRAPTWPCAGSWTSLPISGR